MYTLIAINVVVWIAWNYAQGPLLVFMRDNFLVNLPLLAEGRVWTLLSSEFSHVSLNHLLFNMLGVFVFGGAVGNAIGARHLVHLYVVGGVMASLGHVAFNLVTGEMTPALGASGAVMALGAVYAALFPNRTLLIGFILPMPAWLAVVGFIALDVLGMVGGGTGVAHAAHLGGAAYGLLFWYLRLRKPPRRNFPRGTYGSRL